MDVVKLNDFVATQSNAVKMNVIDSKNEVFYSFIKQTTEAQPKSSSSERKNTKDTKDTTKKESVDKKEDVPETQQKEEVKEVDSKDTKDNMMQQVDLAIFAAAINIVPQTDNQVEQTVTEAPIVQTEAVETQINVNVDTTQQTATVVDTTQQQPLKEQTEQIPQQTVKVETEQKVSQETPKEVEKTVETQPKQQQTEQKVENVKTEDVKTVKTEQTQEVTEEPVVVTEEKTETKSDEKQMDKDTDLPENTTVTNKRTFSDDVINIKVGENTQIADADMAQKVSDKMLAKFSQNENEFEIQLMPKELGKITIKLVMQNGQAHVSMFAENAKTSSLLAEKAREISSIIEQNTGNETSVEVLDKKEMQPQDQNRESKGEGFDRQKEEQQKQHQHKMQAERSVDFIQQMRLGLWK